jgi:lactoylglutathione lyase
MSHLHHVALWASDLDAVCRFYSEYFGAEIGPQYENQAKGFASRFLRFATGAQLEIMKTTTVSPVAVQHGAERMGLTHIAISVGSEEAVNNLTSLLRQAGVTVVSGPRRTGDGYYESVVLDPEGNRVEIAA